MAGKSNKAPKAPKKAPEAAAGTALVPANGAPLDGEILPPVDPNAETEALKAAEAKAFAEASAKVEKFVRDGFAMYFEGKKAAHLSAIAAVMWAADYGDPRYLNLGFDLCGGFGEKETTDAYNFRVWTGRVASYVGPDGKESKWLGFNQKATKEGHSAGFYVKKGPAAVAARSAMDELGLKTGPMFMDNFATKVVKVLTMDDVLQMLEKVVDTASKKEQKVIDQAQEENKGYVPLPESLKQKLREVKAEASYARTHQAAPVEQTKTA